MFTEVNLWRRRQARRSFCILLALASVLMYWTVLSWPVPMRSLAAGVIPCAWVLLIWMWYFCCGGEDMHRVAAAMSALVLIVAYAIFIVSVQGNSSDFTVKNARSIINILPWLSVGIVNIGGLFVLVGCVAIVRCSCCNCPVCIYAEEQVHDLCYDDDDDD